MLNFVESDGLSRVRVCHVGLIPFRATRAEVNGRKWTRLEEAEEVWTVSTDVCVSGLPKNYERLVEPVAKL